MSRMATNTALQLRSHTLVHLDTVLDKNSFWIYFFSIFHLFFFPGIYLSSPLFFFFLRFRLPPILSANLSGTRMQYLVE